MAAPTPYVRRAEADESTLQDALVEYTQQLDDCPLLRGAHLTDVSVTTGGDDIEHRLGRTPSGWIVTRIDTAATIHETASDDRALTLVASADATIDLWVF